jgi:signal transduction histidine kinase/protein-S-isoprenylcysteine O-methyltransferase Ste14
VGAQAHGVSQAPLVQPRNSVSEKSKRILKILFPLKSLLCSLGLAAASGLFACLLWRGEWLKSAQQMFISYRNPTERELITPGFWLGTLLIVSIAACAGFFVERAGARRSFPYLGTGFLLLAIVSLAASRFLQIDILFAPMAFGSAGAIALVQLRRLWSIDTALAGHVRKVSSQTQPATKSDEGARLMSGLKLLQTVLPLEEAIVFQPNEDGMLQASARLRSGSSDSLKTGRNSMWRKVVSLCDSAVATGEIVLAKAGKIDSFETVALPLEHQGRRVGALLLRLREDFEQSDRQLLSAVGAQLARNLQRDEVRKKKIASDKLNFVSARAAGRRLEAFDVVTGLLTEQRFGAHILKEASDGYAVAYLDGTLAYVNESMIRAARISKLEVHDLDLFALLETFRSGVFDEPAIAVRRVLQSGEAYERELHFSERNQVLKLRIALLSENATNGNGNGHHNGNGAKSAGAQPLCLAITVRDVTSTKEHEKLKSDMISLMSHELRTPITSINGFAELLAADEKIPAESREFLTIISNESQRLSRMINTFLSVTQLERGDRQEVLKIPLRLDEVVRDTITNLQSVAKKKRIRLIEQPPARIPPVAADKSLITQVVTNLIGNAIKYSPERTLVTISTLLEAEAVRVTVEDRGYGIPPESIDRIWEKFYRIARDGHEKDEESTGLGLSFVREVVEQHGGTVAVESEVGRGSKFSFTLPRL